MSGGAALPEAVRVAGMVLAALLAAAAVLAPTVRGRAWAMLGALVLTPVLLLAQIWDTPQLHAVRDRPALAAAGAGARPPAAGPLAWRARRPPGPARVRPLPPPPLTRAPGG